MIFHLVKTRPSDNPNHECFKPYAVTDDHGSALNVMASMPCDTDDRAVVLDELRASRDRLITTFPWKARVIQQLIDVLGG